MFPLFVAIVAKIPSVADGVPTFVFITEVGFLDVVVFFTTCDWAVSIPKNNNNRILDFILNNFSYNFNCFLFY